MFNPIIKSANFINFEPKTLKNAIIYLFFLSKNQLSVLLINSLSKAIIPRLLQIIDVAVGVLAELTEARALRTYWQKYSALQNQLRKESYCHKGKTGRQHKI